jgi:uncharacterized cupredoxin-like copper-binding protein
MRRLTTLMIASALAIALTACGSSSSDSSSTEAPSGAGGITVPAADGTPVAVEAGDTSDTVQFLKVDTATVPAGPVTFTLANNGIKNHEMVVLKTDTPYDQLTIGTDDRVSEADSVGEVGEIKPGTTGTVTLDLAPGSYVLVCNIAKHYGQGMRAAFTVE